MISGIGQSPVSTEIIDKARALPGIDAVTRQRYALAHIDGFQIAVSGVDVATIDRAVRTPYIAGSTAALAHGRLAVDQTTAITNRWGIGTPLNLVFANGAATTLTIGAITKPPVGGGKDGGVFQVSLDTLTRSVPTAPTTTVYLTTAPTADKTAVAARLQHLVTAYPQVRLQNQTDYKNQIHQQIDTVLSLIDALLALAITIAALGVVNTLALSVIERTHEIGLLHTLGMTRPQIRRLIHLEAVLVAIHGAVLGLGLGLLWGAAAQQALTAYGITALTIPWTTNAAVLIGAVGIGLAAAVLPAQRAARLSPWRRSQPHRSSLANPRDLDSDAATPPPTASQGRRPRAHGRRPATSPAATSLIGTRIESEPGSYLLTSSTTRPPVLCDMDTAHATHERDGGGYSSRCRSRWCLSADLVDTIAQLLCMITTGRTGPLQYTAPFAVTMRIQPDPAVHGHHDA